MNPQNLLEAYQLFLGDMNTENLQDVVTAPKDDIQEKKDTIKESILQAAKKLYKKDSELSKINLSNILATEKIPTGKGAVIIDTGEDFYPEFMKKIEKIYFVRNQLIVNIPGEKGIGKRNVSNVFGLDKDLINVIHTTKGKKEA